MALQAGASNGLIAPKAPPPLLAPPDSVAYEQLPDTAALIEAPDKRPVAQLSQIPDDLRGGLAANFPEQQTLNDPNQEAYAVLASVRYSGAHHTVLVTTARPSPGALSQSFAPGEKAIQLPGKGAAWLSTDMGGDYPNRVFFMHNDLLITVASTMPADQLQTLAAQVELK
jgi:hypothetical protein